MSNSPQRALLPPHRQEDQYGRQVIHLVDGPARVGGIEAMRRHWFIVLMSVILLCGAGIALGLVRDPVYTAEGRLSVQIAANTPSAIPGSVSAANELASTYSRWIEADPVVKRLSDQTSLARQQVADRISATQVPESSVVTVSASGASEPFVISLANAATDQLRRYVRNLDGPSPGSLSVLAKFKRSVRRYEDRARIERRLERSYDNTLSPSTRDELHQAEVLTETAAAQRDGLRQAYLSGQQLYTAPLEVVGRATTASSDRTPRLQLLGLIGLAAGLAVGVALATARANSTAKRRPG